MIKKIANKKIASKPKVCSEWYWANQDGNVEIDFNQHGRRGSICRSSLIYGEVILWFDVSTVNNQDVHLEMVKTFMLPRISRFSNRKMYWIHQDEPTPCTEGPRPAKGPLASSSGLLVLVHLFCWAQTNSPKFFQEIVSSAQSNAVCLKK